MGTLNRGGNCSFLPGQASTAAADPASAAPANQRQSQGLPNPIKVGLKAWDGESLRALETSFRPGGSPD